MDYTADGKPIIRIGNPNNKAQKIDSSSKVVKREFKNFLKRSEAPAKFVSLPEKLPEINPSPPKIVERDFAGCGMLHVKRAVLSEGSWTTKACTTDGKAFKESSSSFCGSNFVELDDGVYTINKDKSAGQRVTNATIRIVGVNNRINSDDTVEEILTCAVSCLEVWGSREEEVEISSESFKTLFSLVRKKFRDVFVLQNRSEVLEEYLSAVNQRDFGENSSKLRQKITSAVIGWSKIDGKIRYRLGDGAFYTDYILPTVNLENRLQIFQIFSKGFEFREIGHGNEIAEVLWLFSHVAYVLRLFREANAPVTSVLFLKGRTNLLKTATASVLANVFKVERSNIGIRLSSTQASLQYLILVLRDNFLLIDDFSNTAGSDNVKMTRNGEFLIRAIGDGRFSSKMNIADLSKLANDNIRVAVVLTGEEGLDLDTSSMYRIVTLPVHENTFDGTILSKFQREPMILREYFALFIKFIETLPQEFTVSLREKFSIFRQNYSKLLKVPRFVDFASTMHLLAELVSKFAQWCGCKGEFASWYINTATTAVVKVLEAHQQASEESDVVRRFLFALNQSLGTNFGTNVARDEEIYTHDESAHVGFYEDSTQTLWLRFDEVFALVKKFYSRLGQTWNVKEQTIKEELLRRGISEGVLKSKGEIGNEYLKRAKKGSRRRMLVLRMEMLEKFN